MTPAFVPVDTTLAPISFKAFLVSVLAANDLVATTTAEWNDPVGERQDASTSIQARTTQSLGFVKSNKAWDKKLPSIKLAADKVRDVKAPRPKTPVLTSPAKPVRKKIARGGGSFGDIALNFGKYVAALTQLTGYVPVDPTISLAALSAAKTEFDTLNETVSSKEIALTNAQGDRSDLYDAEDGLSVKMLAIKEAVKGQYGQKSPEYLSVKGIKL